MAKKFKVDDRVKINPKSPYNNQAPNGIEGTIRGDNSDPGGDHHYRVNWDGGHSNVYRAKDLILIGGSEPQYEIY